jgi:protease-4
MRILGRPKKNIIAIVRVEGVIMDAEGFGAGRARVIAALKAAERRHARAVVLRINSPGGTVAACQEVFGAISRLREKRIPVVASLGDVAASGGVYIAMGADEVVANPGTVTGSIGVIIRSSDLSDLYRKVGVAPKVVKSGEHKDMLSSYRPMSAAETALLQQVIDDSHDQFVEVIAASRKRERSQIEGIADGRILTGRQALEAGLVDSLGDLDAAVTRAAAIAGIAGKPKVIALEQRKKLWQRILNPLTTHMWNPGIPMWIMPDF